MLSPLLALAMTQQSLTFVQKDSYLYTDCKASTRLQDDSARATLDDTNLSSDCTSYISGFRDALGISNAICDDNPTMGTFARVYIAYMDKHPTRMEGSRAQALLDSLMDAYPCRKLK